jgi:hypothetical protein
MPVTMLVPAGSIVTLFIVTCPAVEQTQYIFAITMPDRLLVPATKITAIPIPLPALADRDLS